jgi:hypothetical protein
VFTTVSEVLAAPNFRPGSSEILVTTYEAVQYYNSEDFVLILCFSSDIFNAIKEIRTHMKAVINICTILHRKP